MEEVRASGLVTSLRELTAERPVVAPGQPQVEAQENTWSLGRDTLDPATAGEVVDALKALGEAWLRSGSPRVPATFYTWYDAQAGRLRLSFSSSGVEDLPFARAIRVVDAPEVVDAVLADAHPGIIPWDQLDEVDPSIGTNEVAQPPVAVWALSSK